MSLKNWKLTAIMTSPLAGEPPKLDAALQWEVASRSGMLRGKKLTRNVRLSEIERVPIPVAKRTISGIDTFCVSDPIMPNPIAEWVDYSNKRIDTHEIALMLAPDQRKSLLIASGPYKMRHAPMRIRLVPSISYFIRCDRSEVNRLLKSIWFLGSRRGIGYGHIEKWEWQEQESDCSIFAERHGEPVLMRTIPFGTECQNVTGYKRGFGGAFPPYWHPETYREIAIPC